MRVNASESNRLIFRRKIARSIPRERERFMTYGSKDRKSFGIS